MLSTRFLASALAFLFVDGAHASACRPRSYSSALSAAESLSTADESASGTLTAGVSNTGPSSTDSFIETLTTTTSRATDTSSEISSFITITTTIESSEVTSSETASSTFFPADLFPCKDAEECVAKVRLCDFVRCGCVGGFCQVETATTDSSTAETSTAKEATTTADTSTTDVIATGTTTANVATTDTTAESSTAETTKTDTTIDPNTTDTATTIATAEGSTTETTTSDTTTTIATSESSMATTTDITTADTTTTTAESSTAETTTSDTTTYSTITETITAETTTTTAEITTTTADTTTTTADTTATAEETTTTSEKASPTLFKCDVYGYLMQKTTLYRVEIATGATTRIATGIGPGGWINGIGYNRYDNQIYGMVMQSSGSQLIKIGADGSWTLLPATVTSRNIIMGDIDNQGSYWFSDTGRPWWKIDLYPGSSTYGKIIQSGTATHQDYIGDWAYVPGGGDYLYAIQYTSTSSTLVRFSRASYTWQTLKAYGDLTGDNVWGGLYASKDGNLYGSENSSGNIYKFPIQPSIGNPVFVSSGPSTSWNDGARCIDSQPPV